MPKKNTEIAERERARGEVFRSRLEAKLEELRAAAAAISATKLAEKAGIERTTMIRIINGERVPTADQILAVARALDAPEIIPEEMRVIEGAVAIPRSVSPSAHRLPPGLEAFLEHHTARLHITKRELWYLERDRTETEAWLVKDDAHWERRLKFWREELALQDQAGAGGGKKGS